MRSGPACMTFSAFAAMAALLVLPSTGSGQLARELGLLPPEDALPAVALLPTESSFALEQLRHDRVHAARVATRHNIKLLFHQRGIAYPAAEIFMRIFKRERSLELWVRSDGADRFELLKTYDICAMAGTLGPKRRQGDTQTPEGFYHIGFFNPRSDFHLSLHINYPNARDRAAGLEGISLGGDIYIHGGCSSEGCLAITDEGIRELYWLSVEARSAGQQRIPVHIFPARLDDQDFEILVRAFAEQPDLGRFWETLKPGYDYFEKHRRLPSVVVNARGEYSLNGHASATSVPAGTAVPAGALPPAPATVAPAARPAPVPPQPRRPLGTPVVPPPGGGAVSGAAGGDDAGQYIS
jgi:murein L,D-transpeptidase YafK